MIIDKILAQGEHSLGNSQDSNYERYTFEFNTKDGTPTINLHTASLDKFSGANDAEKLQKQQEQNRRMLLSLIEELSYLLDIKPDEKAANFFKIDNDNCKLSITSFGYDRLVKYANNHRDSLDPLGNAINIINIFTALYFRNDYIAVIFKHILKNEFAGLVCYRTDHESPSGKPHQFFIAPLFPNLPNAQVMTNISEGMAQQLRDAFKQALAKLLKIRSKFIVDTCFDVPPAPPGGLLSFNLSDASLKKLLIKVGLGKDYQIPQATILLNSPIAADVADPEVAPIVKMIDDNYLLKSQDLICALNEQIFDPNRNKLLTQADKERLIKIVKEKIELINDIEILSDFYKHINLAVNKSVLNVHQRPKYDRIFFKNNTNSWQQLIEYIRSRAYKLLLQSLGLDHLFDGTNKVADPIIPDPENVIATLQFYLENKLFCEHRSNDHFRNLFHETTTITKMRKVIEACEEQINQENRARKISSSSYFNY